MYCQKNKDEYELKELQLYAKVQVLISVLKCPMNSMRHRIGRLSLQEHKSDEEQKIKKK